MGGDFIWGFTSAGKERPCNRTLLCIHVCVSLQVWYNMAAGFILLSNCTLMFSRLKLVFSLSLHVISLKCLHVTTCWHIPCTGRFFLHLKTYIRLFCISTVIWLARGRNAFSLTMENLFDANILFEHGTVGKDCSCMGSNGISLVVFLNGNWTVRCHQEPCMVSCLLVMVNGTWLLEPEMWFT